MLAEALNDVAVGIDPALILAELGLDPDPVQEEILRSADDRLMVTAYRQWGKSQAVSALALHTAVYRDDSLILIISRSLRQSGEIFAKVVRAWRKLGKPHGSTAENSTTLELSNGSRIVSLPPNVDTIVGFSAPRLIILDEGARIGDEILTATLPMLKNRCGRLVTMSTPRGRRGWYFSAFTDPSAAWRKIEVRASQCPRVDKNWLAEQRMVMGERAYAQEYELEWLDAVGSVFGLDEILAAFKSDKPPFPLPLEAAT